MNVNNADNTVASLQKQITTLQGQLKVIEFVYHWANVLSIDKTANP